MNNSLVNPIRNSLIGGGTLIGLALLGQPAQAVLITGVTASVNVSSEIGGVNIMNTVNGIGLPGNTPALTGSHAAGSPSNSWSSFSGSGFANNTTGIVTFDFQTLYALDGFSFWNFNGNFSNVGIQGVTITTSTDGTNYNPLQNITGPTSFNSTTGAGTFAIGSANASVPVQQYTSAITNARYVRFAVTSNYGHMNSFGFAEAQFSAATPVPWETDVLSVIGATTLFGFGVWTKRKRKLTPYEMGNKERQN